MRNPIYKVEQIKNLKELINRSERLYGDRVAYKLKTNIPHEYKEITYKEFANDIKALGTKLIELGLKDKRIAIISENRYDWNVAYLATVTGTGVVVPLDKSLPQNEIENLIIRSEAEAVLYSGNYAEVFKTINEKNNTKLKYFISMEAEKQAEFEFLQKDLIEEGKQLIKKGNKEFINAEIDNEKMSFMLFTSGTTSMSKAVMLSHKNISANICDIASVIKIVPEDIMLSFLPLHHTFECTVGFLYPIYSGACIAFCDGIRHIAENIKEYKISAMISVPILFENMYKKVMKGIEKKGKLETVKKGVKISKLLLKFGIDVRKKLFKEIHANLGGNVRLFVSGGAALDPETEKGFNELGFKLYQGYGLTETSPVIAAEDDKYVKIGSIGKALPSIEVKIIDKNEQGIGELLAKGPSVMLGYYNNEEETKNVIEDDRWFHTGDLGYIDKDGYIFICGRKKNVIVLKNGKNIYPEELESSVNKIEGIKESIVYGKPNPEDEIDLKICAKIVYDKEIVKQVYNVTTEEEIKKSIWEEIKKINKTMPAYKYIREITITEEDLIKTTTQKVKRHEEIAKIMSE